MNRNQRKVFSSWKSMDVIEIHSKRLKTIMFGAIYIEITSVSSNFNIDLEGFLSIWVSAGELSLSFAIIWCWIVEQCESEGRWEEAAHLSLNALRRGWENLAPALCGQTTSLAPTTVQQRGWDSHRQKVVCTTFSPKGKKSDARLTEGQEKRFTTALVMCEQLYSFWQCYRPPHILIADESGKQGVREDRIEEIETRDPQLPLPSDTWCNWVRKWVIDRLM